MANEQAPIETGIVFPSGRLKVSEENRKLRIEELKSNGLNPTLFEPETESEDGSSAGYALERSMLLSKALTLRNQPVLWAAKGGFGSTSILRSLEMMLPPVISDKVLIGYSDISFIGSVLSRKYPNLTYIMAGHVFEPHLFTQNKMETDLLLRLIKGDTPDPIDIVCQEALVLDAQEQEIDGTIMPLNLSLAESLCSLDSVKPGRGQVIFIEEVNEDLYRVLRKIDSLVNSGFLNHSEAIVIGEFTECTDENDKPVSLSRIAKLIHARTGLPTFVMPIFGHAKTRMPLVLGAKVVFTKSDNGTWSSTLGFERQKSRKTQMQLGQRMADFELKKMSRLHAHFMGIGGTGMTAVAGLAVRAGVKVTGSDNPIYPPMSDVLKALDIEPYVGYQASNFKEADPSLVVLANAISRKDGNLNPNGELEELLRSHVPTLSFPAFLREYFLRKSLNIVVAGTHGKTSTSCAISYALKELDQDPSYLIGGSPRNFDDGFYLGKKDLFVLEGDEYDTALFDKGPKFLHYEPRVSLINNIEFDHADIYADLDAVCAEFSRLARLTGAKKGIVVANLSDKNVKGVCSELFKDVPIIGFTNANSEIESPKDLPVWKMISFETLVDGSKIRVEDPSGNEHTVVTGLFGEHNALNIAASMAVLHSYHLLQQKHEGYTVERLNIAAREISSAAAQRWAESFSGFKGVRRRFEQLFQKNHISVFDDFAHHPTAVRGTLQAFKDYHDLTEQKGKLRVCFDPRNATMRRNILQSQLAESLKLADQVYLGKVAVDLRIPENERMNGNEVVQELGSNAVSFQDNKELLSCLSNETEPGDTVVFMSSGSFDSLPRSFVSLLETKFSQEASS